MRQIKVGDTVEHTLFGTKVPLTAKVIRIEVCKDGSKYGKPVSKCDLDSHSEVVLDLDNGHWCYKSQVLSINS